MPGQAAEDDQDATRSEAVRIELTVFWILRSMLRI